MWIDVMSIKLILIVFLSFLIWLEREIKNQPAWLRTHILIWIWSTLLMIISIQMPLLHVSPVWDPARIAAQVVSWIWFIWAWVIMKMWFNTKWLTTAANIWVTSAIWLCVWAGMYMISILATLLILFNLTVITSIKSRYIKQYRYCNIEIDIVKDKLSLKKLLSTIDELPIRIISKNTRESDSKITIKVMCKVKSDVSSYHIHQKLKKTDKHAIISISENNI